MSGLAYTSLTKEQTKSLEDIQRRALQVIIGNIPNEEACCKRFVVPSVVGATRLAKYCGGNFQKRKQLAADFVTFIYFLWLLLI